MYKWDQHDKSWTEAGRGKLQVWKLGSNDPEASSYYFRLIFPPTGRSIGSPYLPCDIDDKLVFKTKVHDDQTVRMRLRAIGESPNGDELRTIAFKFLGENTQISEFDDLALDDDEWSQSEVIIEPPKSNENTVIEESQQQAQAAQDFLNIIQECIKQ